MKKCLSYSIYLLVWIFLGGKYVESAHCDGELGEKRRQWLEQLIGEIKNLDETERSSAIHSSIIGLVLSGDVKRARGLVREHSEDQDECDYRFVSIVNIQVQRGDLDSAVETFGLIANPYHRDRARESLVSGYSEAKNLDAAAAVMAEMSTGSRKDSATASMAMACAAMGEQTRAIDLVQEITSDDARERALEDIALAKSGQVRPLDQLSDRICGSVSLLTAFSDEGAHDQAILALVAAESGDVTEAKRLINQVSGEQRTPDVIPTETIDALIVVAAYARIGKKEKARSLALKMFLSKEGDWSGTTNGFCVPLLLNTLIYLKQDDAIDSILKRLADRGDSTVLSIGRTCVAMELLADGRVSEFERRLTAADSSVERASLLAGAIAGY